MMNARSLAQLFRKNKQYLFRFENQLEERANHLSQSSSSGERSDGCMMSGYPKYIMDIEGPAWIGYDVATQ